MITLMFKILLFLPSTFSQRTPLETLVLADCESSQEPGTKQSQQMLYYSGEVWPGWSSFTNAPSMVAAVPWTGTYPWGDRPEGAKGTMPNGDFFVAGIDGRVKDPNPSGDAWHDYEWEIPLKCYSYHWRNVYELEEGLWCHSQHVCNHRGAAWTPPMCEALDTCML